MNETKQTKPLDYRIGDIAEIVHPFAPKGYEILSETFIGRIGRLRPMLEGEEPLMLNVWGSPTTKEERQAARRAIKTHYTLAHSQLRNELRAMGAKLLWFTLSTVVSAFLIYAAKPGVPDALVQFLYLPLWFFAYRIMIYCIFDLPPLVKELRWTKRLASAKLLFGNEEGAPAAAEEEEADSDAFAENYFHEKNEMQLECVVDTPADLTEDGGLAERRLITADLAEYLEYGLPFIRPETRVSLTVDCRKDTEPGAACLGESLRNHFALRIKETEALLRQNRNRIIGFTVALVLSCLLLTYVGENDAALHESVVIPVWFFGDYLIEYVIMTPILLGRKRKRYRKLRDMELAIRKANG
ncbi:MAG: hypothetical protein Q4C53_09365 [Clostridia bacterium]|nr:hypothetical protein [Clostridia bacterium]